MAGCRKDVKPLPESMMTHRMASMGHNVLTHVRTIRNISPETNITCNIPTHTLHNRTIIHSVQSQFLLSHYPCLMTPNWVIKYRFTAFRHQSVTYVNTMIRILFFDNIYKLNMFNYKIMVTSFQKTILRCRLQCDAIFLQAKYGQ